MHTFKIMYVVYRQIVRGRPRRVGIKTPSTESGTRWMMPSQPYLLSYPANPARTLAGAKETRDTRPTIFRTRDETCTSISLAGDVYRIFYTKLQ